MAEIDARTIDEHPIRRVIEISDAMPVLPAAAPNNTKAHPGSGRHAMPAAARSSTITSLPASPQIWLVLLPE